jgi:hypothetical protein
MVCDIRSVVLLVHQEKGRKSAKFLFKMSSSKPRNRSRSPVRRNNERSHHSGPNDKLERRNSKDKGPKQHEEKSPSMDAKSKVQVKLENHDSRNNNVDSKENKSSSNSNSRQSYVSTSSRTYVNPVTGKTERKFSNRCRLFVGNISDMSEDEFKKMFEKYGEYSEAYVNKEKSFGFIKMVSDLNMLSSSTNMNHCFSGACK